MARVSTRPSGNRWGREPATGRGQGADVEHGSKAWSFWGPYESDAKTLFLNGDCHWNGRCSSFVLIDQRVTAHLNCNVNVKCEFMISTSENISGLARYVGVNLDTLNFDDVRKTQVFLLNAHWAERISMRLGQIISYLLSLSPDFDTYCSVLVDSNYIYRYIIHMIVHPLVIYK